MPHDVLLLREERGAEQQVEVRQTGSVAVGDTVLTVVQTRPGEIRAGERMLWAVGDGDDRWVFVDGRVYVFRVQRPDQRLRRPTKQGGSLSAPMPATVIKVLVAPADPVHAGDIVIILEAMKMELPVRATTDGEVSSVRCREGELVQAGQELIQITPNSEPSHSGIPASGRLDSAEPAPSRATEDK